MRALLLLALAACTTQRVDREEARLRARCADPAATAHADTARLCEVRR